MNKKVIKNPLQRQPPIPARVTGLNANNEPINRNLKAVRNPLQRQPVHR